MAQGHLSARDRELIALAVAEINGSAYCLSAHYAFARELGIAEEEIRMARHARSSDPQKDSMLRFVQAVTLQRGEVSDADFKLLRTANYTDSQIAEILVNIGLNILVNYFNKAVRTEVDFPLVKPGSEAPIHSPPQHTHV